MPKCPPGVICFENFTFVYIIFALVLIIYFMYTRETHNNITIKNEDVTNGNSNSRGLFPRPSYSFSNVQEDVLLNPYSPPLRDERIIQTTDIRGGIPINISTQGSRC